MDLEKLNASVAKYEVQFDEQAVRVKGVAHPYTDIAQIHYFKPKKRVLLRFLTTILTVILAAWIVLASQQKSDSIQLAVGLLVGLTIARFYLLGKVFPKLSVTLKNGEKVAVMQKFDLIAADRMYERLVEQTKKPV